MANQSRKRPLSRASTASIHSANTQGLDQSFDHSAVYQAQWISDQSHPNHSSIPQMSPEDMILHAASQLQAGGLQSGNMHPQVNPAAVGLQFAPHGLPQNNYPASHDFTQHDNQMMDRDDQEEDSTAMPKAPTKGSRSSANNELEMRQLFSTNKHRSLQEVATELHGNERGPNSERTRQVFAMLWCVPILRPDGAD